MSRIRTAQQQQKHALLTSAYGIHACGTDCGQIEGDPMPHNYVSPVLSTHPGSIRTRVAGHLIVALPTNEVMPSGATRYEVSIDTDCEYVAYPLRSIYSSDAATALSAAMEDVLTMEDDRSNITGHTWGCSCQSTLDESDCDCVSY